MKKITFNELRKLTAGLFEYIITDTMAEIYTKNISKYPEIQWNSIVTLKRDETKELLEKIFISDQNSLKTLYLSTDPDVICCFYIRYWRLINLVKEYSTSDKNTIDIPENEPVAFMRILLFAIAEGSSIA